MNPTEHLAAVLEGRASPEALDWLTDGVRRAYHTGMPLERVLGLPGRVRQTYLRYRRDTCLYQGALVAGSAAKFVQAFRDWQDEHPPETAGVEVLFEELDALEDLGVKIPQRRQARRVAKLKAVG